MNLIRKSRAIIMLWFFIATVFYSQAGYAKILEVNPFDTMNSIGTNSVDFKSGIKMLGMGLHSLDKGRYRVELLLENSESYDNFNAINDNGHVFKLYKDDNDTVGTRVTVESVKMSPECSSGRLSDSCTFTMEGTVIAKDPQSYKSYSVAISYKDQDDNDDLSSPFKDSIVDIEMSTKVEKLSPSSGKYTYSIKNVSQEDIKIEKISLGGERCFDINEPFGDIKLDKGATHDISLTVNKNGANQKLCRDTIIIKYVKYQEGGDLSRALPKIVLIRVNAGNIKCRGDRDGYLNCAWDWVWDNKWKIVTTVSLGVAAIFGCYHGYEYYQDWREDLVTQRILDQNYQQYGGAEDPLAYAET